MFNYVSPEARFEERAGLEADVWALGCAIFEIRAGRPLFESFFSSDADILKQTVGLLGRLPDPRWSVFEERIAWFEEDGEPKSVEDQERAGVLLKASKSSSRAVALSRYAGRGPVRSRGTDDRAVWRETAKGRGRAVGGSIGEDAEVSTRGED